jgi:FkbM family methyltransferase
MKDYESTEIAFVCNYLDRVAEAKLLSGIFVDVGAHVGLWSINMSHYYQARYHIVPTIYAMEPDSSNYIELRRNAQTCVTGIVPAQVAAWNKNTHLHLKMNENPGRHRVIESVVGNAEDTLKVQAVTLDTVSESGNRLVDVIKIDVEGAELMVLNGARGVLTENEQMLVMVEYSIGHFAQYGYTPQQLSNFMQAHGYRFARPYDQVSAEKIKAGDIKRVMFVKGEIE